MRERIYSSRSARAFAAKLGLHMTVFVALAATAALSPSTACGQAMPVPNAQDTGLLGPAKAGDAAALAALKAAAEAGGVRAQHELGAYLLEKGAYAEAYQWIHRATAAGDPRAMNDLGAMTLGGYGVEKRDPALARQYFERAGAKGFAGGYRMAAEIAFAGGGGKPDREAGLRLLRQAATAGDVEAQFRLASLLAGAARRDEDMAESVKWLRLAAAAGHALAAEQLGLLTLAGLGVQRNAVEARQWLEKAAAGRRVPAQMMLARLHTEVPELRDAAVARRWLASAAAAGDREARVLLYEQIIAEGATGEEALPGLRSAAEAGHSRAALRLAQAYQSGRGMPADASLAQFWRARAAASGELSALEGPVAPGAPLDTPVIAADARVQR